MLAWRSSYCLRSGMDGIFGKFFRNRKSGNRVWQETEIRKYKSQARQKTENKNTEFWNYHLGCIYIVPKDAFLPDKHIWIAGDVFLHRVLHCLSYVHVNFYYVHHASLRSDSWFLVRISHTASLPFLRRRWSSARFGWEAQNTNLFIYWSPQLIV